MATMVRTIFAQPSREEVAAQLERVTEQLERRLAEVAGMIETVAADVNASGITVVSVDLPSGMSADTPHLIGDCIEASMTVTLTAPKLPLVLPPSEPFAGDVVIAHIGITQEIVDKKKEGMTLMKRRAAPELDGGSIWMMAVGAERVFFTCHADSIDQALAQTRDAFPGQPVASACSIARSLF